MLVRWLVFIHVLSAITFFLAHGASTAMVFKLRSESDFVRIRAFFIHPQWARKGIGRRIIQACEDAAKADGFTRMELVATMPGEPLYAAMGYEVTKRFEQSVPDETLIPLAHMKKSLI